MTLNKITSPKHKFYTNADKVDIFSGHLNTVITEVNLKATKTSPTFTGTVVLPDVTMSGNKNGQVFSANSFMCPAPGTDWTPSALGVTVGASKSGVICYIPLNFLKVGDEIVSYTLLGNALESAAITTDCKLVKLTAADPLTSTDVTGGDITQHTADGKIEDSKTLTAVETVVAGSTYLLKITATTGSGDSLSLIGANVVVNRK